MRSAGQPFQQPESEWQSMNVEMNARAVEGVNAPPPWRRVVVALVHPSNYDHNLGRGIGAFVQTYRYGVMPSNSLRLLHGLTEDALKEAPFDSLPTEVHAFEDSVRRDQAAFQRLLSRFPEEGTLLVVGFVAVQSNQFPRACDLIRRARAHGAVCVMGGPHVTAGINVSLHGISAIDPMRPGVVCPHRMPPELQSLMDDEDVIIFHGDADNGEAWLGVLRDIHAGRASHMYEAGLARDLGDPGRVYTRRDLDGFVVAVAAVDTERGCPFKCRFCAAIQAHGREMRCRDPRTIVDWVRRQCEAYGGQMTILFASDNLARNPHWRPLLAGLAELRDTGLHFSIWAEADVLCNAGPNAGFLEAFARAGGHGLFLGIESMNPENIREAGKKQNNVEELPAFLAECQRHGISPEGGYIIGFPHDTPESVQRDVEHLAAAGMARAWFFMKTLLPGSQDWVEALMAGRFMSSDLNEYDSTCVVSEHERMTKAEWLEAYETAVRTFYSARTMITILARHPEPRKRWRLIKGFLWCRWAHFAEQTHPMIAGLIRCRPFGERRPGQAHISRMQYWASEAWRHVRYLGCLIREFYIFQQVILESEWRLRGGEEAWANRGRAMGWLRRSFAAPMRREWLNEFWIRYGSLKWRLLSPLRIGWHLKALPHAATEMVYTVRFLVKFIHGLRMPD